MVMIVMDSQELEAEAGETVLQVASRNNIQIPTLCHHPVIPPYSACRVCMVEVKQGNRTRLTASCSLPVSNGMEVRTTSERVLKARKVLMELYLARCPDSEELKAFAADLGVDTTRFDSYREVDDQCILCGLCVNICKESGNSTMGFIGRGTKRRIGTPFDKRSDHCLVCGACDFVCPTNCIDLKAIATREPIPRKSEFDEGLVQRGAMNIPFPQAIPNVPMIDRDSCNYFINGTCKICEKVCEPGAVKHDQEDEEIEVKVGSVIVSPGFEEYVPPTGDSYGYNVYPNVLTSIQFERMLSASGPYQGHVKRISDGETPKKIAWLQCVGSRDESCNSPYCSSVCCMYATKEAVIAKEHQGGDLDTHIYFMDHRSFGKDFDRYYERSKEEYGVIYRRSRVPRVEQDRETKDLLIRYVDDNGEVQEERYDMVVLSVGIQPCEALGDLSSALEINLNGYGFVETETYTPVETSRKGVYASGTVTEPKDIPESVTQASAAAADAAKDIASARGTEVVEKSYPSERNVMSEVPRIGVFICHCGINIGGVIDVPGVVEYAKTLPYVVLSDDNLFTCSQDSQEGVKEKIVELGLNRVVIASCTPRTHEALFQDTLREAGLNPHLFEMANLRDQNSWVHRGDPDTATGKAKDSVRMAVMKAAELFSVSHTKIPVNHDALVIGGGIAGMTAALSLGDQGFQTYLVEREAELGGHLRQIHLGVSGEDPQKLLKDKVERVTTHPNIKVYTGTRIEEIGGYVGNFNSNLKVEGAAENVLISHGVVIVATGALPYEPTEYGYGRNADVLTQTDLETMLAAGGESLSDVKEMVMIQCIGSRNDEHPYCSRVCCSNAIKNALKLKEVDPSATIYILYRDIRTYGYREDTLYRKAREKGIIFLRFEKGEDPVMEEKDGEMTITLKERVLGREITLHPDKLVLSRGMVPQDNMELAQQLKVPLNQDSFFSEAHVKLRPVDFSADGIFLCGLAHSPRFIEEAIIQAKATAARAVTIISRDSLETLGSIAHVNPRYCAGCRMCIDVCPYDAIDFDQEKRIAVVNEILCQGCGACATACPGGVSQQNTFTKRQVFAMIDTFMEG